MLVDQIHVESKIFLTPETKNALYMHPLIIDTYKLTNFNFLINYIINTCNTL